MLPPEMTPLSSCAPIIPHCLFCVHDMCVLTDHSDRCPTKTWHGATRWEENLGAYYQIQNKIQHNNIRLTQGRGALCVCVCRAWIWKEEFFPKQRSWVAKRLINFGGEGQLRLQPAPEKANTGCSLLHRHTCSPFHPKIASGKKQGRMAGCQTALILHALSIR